MTRVLVLLCVCLSVGGAARAQIQCPPIIGDDGFHFSAGCCTIVTPNIPTFPQLTVSGLYFCITNCTTSSTFPVSMTLGAPVQTGPACDDYQATWTVTPTGPSGQPNITTPMMGVNLKYLRTYLEIDSFGQLRQIWLFAVNARLPFAPTDTQPCPHPPCANFMGIGDPWFTGILEYASAPEPPDDPPGKGGEEPPFQDCAVSLAITHGVGCLQHFNNPTFNTQSLPAGIPQAHDDMTFHLVAPGAPGAPGNFTVATALPLPPASDIDVTNGSLEALRSTQSITNPVCQAEYSILPATINLMTMLVDCSCVVMPPNVLHFHQDVKGRSGCANQPAFQSAGGLIPALPTGFMQYFLGQFTLPAGVWPGNRRVWNNVGLFDYNDVDCVFPAPQPTFHFTYGGTTFYPPGQGWSRQLFPQPGGPTGILMMCDFVNSLVLVGMPPTQNPRVGINSRAAMLWQISR